MKAGEFGEERPLTREWTTQPLRFARCTDVLICVVGATAGKLNLGIDCAIGRSVAAIRPAEILDQRFLYYFLLTRVDRLRAGSAGSAQGVISREDLARIEILLPPIAEQRRIVDVIGQIRLRTGAMAKTLRGVVTRSESVRQAILAAAFRGDLTADWREKNPNVEPAWILLDHIRKERQQLREDAEFAKAKANGNISYREVRTKRHKETEPLETNRSQDLPKGWASATIEDLSEVGTGSTPLRSESKYWFKGDVPWITSAATSGDSVEIASDFVTLEAIVAHRLKTYQPGTLLIAMYGEGKTRGQIAELRIPAAINQALAAIVLNDEAACLRQFVKLFLELNYEKSRGLAAGGVQPNLNLQLINSIRLPIAPADEALVIVDRINAIFTRLMTIAEKAQNAVALIAALEQSLLKKVFRGEFVRHDPNEEPASVLLERIRAQREPNSSRTRHRRSVPDFSTT